MEIHRAHKIQLDLNNKQAHYMQCACGCARFAYNWGLTEWKRAYEEGEKPSSYNVTKSFTAIKREQFPFIMEVTKCAPEAAFLNLGKAFSNFFRNLKHGKKPGYPKYKKKGLNDSFGISNDQCKVKNKKIRIPRLGWVRMRESWRFPEDKIMSAIISKTAGKWFISINSQTQIADPTPKVHSVGVDVGIKSLAVTSDNVVFENPKALKTNQDRVRLVQKSVSRKKKGSNNRKKAVMQLAKLHYRISNIRKDSAHKASCTITKSAGLIGIEDLNVSGMLKNHKLSKAISDAGLSEFLRQIEYKALWNGSKVVKADRFYPSSKTCSACGAIKDTLKLSERVYNCSDCGLSLDRDLNAAINLKQYAVGSTVKACCLGSSGSTPLESNETTDWAGISLKPNI